MRIAIIELPDEREDQIQLDSLLKEVANRVANPAPTGQVIGEEQEEECNCFFCTLRRVISEKGGPDPEIMPLYTNEINPMEDIISQKQSYQTAFMALSEGKRAARGIWDDNTFIQSEDNKTFLIVGDAKFMYIPSVEDLSAEDWLIIK